MKKENITITNVEDLSDGYKSLWFIAVYKYLTFKIIRKMEIKRLKAIVEQEFKSRLENLVRLHFKNDMFNFRYKDCILYTKFNSKQQLIESGVCTNKVSILDMVLSKYSVNDIESYAVTGQHVIFNFHNEDCMMFTSKCYDLINL